MSKLKKCPFCGGDADYVRKGTARVSNIVSCNECGVSVECGATFNFHRTWNSRQESKQLQASQAEVERLKAIIKDTIKSCAENELYETSSEIERQLNEAPK